MQGVTPTPRLALFDQGSIPAASFWLTKRRANYLSDYAGWIELAAGFSVVFVVLSYLLFEYVLEE